MIMGMGIMEMCMHVNEAFANSCVDPLWTGRTHRHACGAPSVVFGRCNYNVDVTAKEQALSRRGRSSRPSYPAKIMPPRPCRVQVPCPMA
jgi:hypothetical protein